MDVQIKSTLPDAGKPECIETSCRLLVYLNRVEYETYFLVGKRYDTLARVGNNWKVLQREIIIDQNVMMAKNLSTYF